MRRYVPLLLFFLLPSFAGGITIDEIRANLDTIRARVELLRVELQNVQAPFSQSASTTSPQFQHLPCVSLARTLSRGSHGEDVQVLQRFLIKAGLLAEGNATGYFGSLTEAAVGRWQIAQGLVLTTKDAGSGIIGPQTRRSILLSCSQKQGQVPSQAQCPLANSPPPSMCAGRWEKIANSKNCLGMYQCITSSTTLNSSVGAMSTPNSATTSSDQTSQLSDNAYSKLLQELRGSSQSTSSQNNLLLSTSTTMCVNEGQQFAEGTTLSVPCGAGHCTNSTSGYITGVCTRGLWCIPLTTNCAASLSDIDVNTYRGGGATPIGTSGSLNCPQNGWRAYLDCSVLPACRTGWNICTAGGWVYDSDQSVH